MGLTNCRDCGHQISEAAKTCPSCGLDNPGPSGVWIGRLKMAGGAVVLLLVAILVMRSLGGQMFSTCKILALRNAEDAFIVNGEFDYGIVTHVTAGLDGAGREVEISVRLETSEGDFTRKTRVAIGDKGQRSVQVQFPEPTIGGKVDRSVASCR